MAPEPVTCVTTPCGWAWRPGLKDSYHRPRAPVITEAAQFLGGAFGLLANTVYRCFPDCGDAPARRRGKRERIDPGDGSSPSLAAACRHRMDRSLAPLAPRLAGVIPATSFATLADCPASLW